LIFVRRKLRNFLAIVLALYILGGPIPEQVFGMDHDLLRVWRMYSGVGLSVPYGTLFVSREDGSTVRRSLAQILEVERMRDLARYLDSATLRIDAPSDIREIIEALKPICNRLEARERVRFQGQIARWDGWESIELTHVDICREEGS
jgi:hypothetical protein